MSILFKNWIIEVHDELLARQYDNLSRSLVVTGDLPEGWDWKIKVRCHGNYDSIPLKPMDGGMGVVLTENQLAFGGSQYPYDLQLVGTQGDVKKHTNVIQVYIGESLSGTGTWPAVPSEFTVFEARMRDITAHPPIPGENGCWQLYDPDTGEYVDSQFPLPEGTGGGSGGTPGADGGYYTPSVTQPDVNTMQVSYTPSKTGMPTVQAAKVTLPAGPAGPAGATPNIQIGTVETLPAGSPATASMAGTPENPLLNLGIPMGADGSGGGWETVIDIVIAEAAGVSTDEMPDATEVICVFAAPAGATVTLTATSKSFGRSLNGIAIQNVTYGKVGFIWTRKINGNAVILHGTGDTTSATPALNTTTRAGIGLFYLGPETDTANNIPLIITSAFPAGTIIKVFVR